MRVTDLIDFETGRYMWDVIETIPQFAKLKECQQNSKWHAEGSAWVHTQAVCKWAVEFAVTNALDSYNRAVLLTAALFHDIGKSTTTSQGKDGRWHSYGHEMESERLARLILWDEGYGFREDVCGLVRWHMEPLNLFGRKDMLEQIIYISKRIPSWNLLYLLKLADLEGSTQEDEEAKTSDRLKLSDIRRVAGQIGCLHDPSIVPLKGQYKWEKFDRDRSCAPKAHVTVLIGLSGAGKSTFVQSLGDDIVVVSRDTIRAELGFCKEGEKVVCSSEQERTVSKVFDDTILAAAKLKKHIVIDNLSLKRKYRDAYKTLLANYNVTWDYVYIEAPTLDDNLARRADYMTRSIYENMIMGFDWPSPSEYNSFKTITTR